MAARRDTSLSRRQPSQGGTKAAAYAKLNKDQGHSQPTLRTLDGPTKSLDGPVTKTKTNVKLGTSPIVPLKGPVGKVYSSDSKRGKKLK